MDGALCLARRPFNVEDTLAQTTSKTGETEGCLDLPIDLFRTLSCPPNKSKPKQVKVESALQQDKAQTKNRIRLDYEPCKKKPNGSQQVKIFSHDRLYEKRLKPMQEKTPARSMVPQPQDLDFTTRARPVIFHNTWSELHQDLTPISKNISAP